MANRMELTVNGTAYQIEVDAEQRLLGVLRDVLDLTGSKYGCGEGECGACTVLVDGTPIRACLSSVGEAVGKQITTIEGLAQDGRLHPLQEAFLEVDAFQCGYCTPGLIVSGVALLNSNPAPTRREVVAFMEGHVCRCGTYPRILAAINKAADALKAG